MITLGWVCACNSSPANAPADHLIHRTDTPEKGAIHTRIVGTDVALGDLPFVDWIGLPASGRADISIDVRVPNDHGERDFRGATGKIHLRCAPCRVGDDNAMLKTGGQLPFGSELEFGYLDFDRAETTIVLANGHAKVQQWTVASPDVSIELLLDAELARNIADSRIEGCLRFKESPTLEARRPKTNAVVNLTGAPRGPDGFFSIRLTGTMGAMQRQAKICDGSAHPSDAPVPCKN